MIGALRKFCCGAYVDSGSNYLERKTRDGGARTAIQPAVAPALQPTPLPPMAASPMRRSPAADERALERRLTVAASQLLQSPEIQVRFSESWGFNPAGWLLTVPRELRNLHTDAGVTGSLCREIGRWLYSRHPPQGTSPSNAFCWLWHAVDQVRTNILVESRYPQAHAMLLCCYTEELRDGRPQDQVSEAESFTRQLIASHMFATDISASETVRAALAAAAPWIKQAVTRPSGADLAHADLSADLSQQLADATFAVTRDHLWKAFEGFLQDDVTTLARAAQGDTSTALVCPVAEPQWPWTPANPGPLAYDPISQRCVQLAQQQLRARAHRQAQAPGGVSHFESLVVVNGRVTWEQAMRCKVLQPPAPSPQTDWHAEVARLAATATQTEATVAGTLSEYDRLCRQESATLTALVDALRIATTQNARMQRRRIVGETGKFDLRLGMQASLRAAVTGRHDPRVFVRYHYTAVAAPPEFILCVDISGSMRGPNLQAARTAFVVFHEALAALDLRAGSLAYSETPTLLHPLGYHDRCARAQSLHALTEQGGTNEIPALAMARAMFDDRRASARVILFLTDGGASQHTKACVAQLEAETDIRVVGIGIGADCGSVAHVYGRHIIVPAVQDLPHHIGTALADILWPLGKTAKVE